MFFIYDENKGRKGFVSMTDANATSLWLNHFSNALYLRFIAQHPKTNTIEKMQANRELAIADKKMNFWAKHPNYNKEHANMEADNLKRNWKVPA